ncbi:MAG TPA: DUF1326 domain-containing protein [Thermoanaerobaculia bacterium]|nr:DUF1326 domain-containing protein [Thermoanaerobaculia bacterium]
MRKVVRYAVAGVIPVALVLFVTLFGGQLVAGDAAAKPSWSMNASIIEACSCPMFCQCYFNPEPSAHHEGHELSHFCRFNNAVKVNKGNFGDTKLDDALFWVAGDLGSDFSKGQMDWAVLTFDPSVTAKQREGITAILGHVYPVKWNSFTIAKDAKMEWSSGKDMAVAKLDGGKAAEVVLTRFQGMTDDPVVIKNLVYWGAPRNDGFVMMPNKVEAYRLGDKAFEYKGSNGFMITFDINSNDVKPAAVAAK